MRPSLLCGVSGDCCRSGFGKPAGEQVPKLVRRSGDGLFWASFDWAATRAFALPWTMDGYLRVNLRGREPHGIVEPGAERTALLDEIETMLGELKIAGTDKPAVRRIVRAQEMFAGRASAELPDLMVLWDNGAPIEAIESPRLGRIRNRDIGPRGSHTDRGAIFAWGPALRRGRRYRARAISTLRRPCWRCSGSRRRRRWTGG